MRPDPKFSLQPGAFWAHVRLVSERLGYSLRARKGQPKVLRSFTIEEVQNCLEQIGLDSSHIFDDEAPTDFGARVAEYLNRRRELLSQIAEPNLMNRDEARIEFEALRSSLAPTCPLPMNKQKGAKRHHAYLVGIVNMLTEKHLDGRAFDPDPRGLTVVTQDDRPLRTFSRWMDGAYPSVVDPTAVWEVKEYYGTTTFGSRVADGVYETMLDGYEFAELAEHENREVKHYLIVDDYFTWWDCGRSYLCRIVDMLHMGLVDEVLFGREVIVRWPEIVESWP